MWFAKKKKVKQFYWVQNLNNSKLCLKFNVGNDYPNEMAPFGLMTQLNDIQDTTLGVLNDILLFLRV